MSTESSNGTTIIRIKRKREEEPLNSLLIEAAVKKSTQMMGASEEDSEQNSDESGTQTHVFKLMDTVGLKTSENQTARIKRKIRRAFKKQTKVADSLDDRKSKRQVQQKEKKKNDLELRRKWNGVVNEWEDFSISDTLLSKKSQSELTTSKPVFSKRTKRRDHPTENKSKLPESSEIQFIDIDLTSMVKGGNKSAAASSPHPTSPEKVANSSPSKVLNPLQRRMDEAIFTAFSTGSTANVALLIDQLVDPNFSREVDGTTPLMAASWCGDLSLCTKILSAGANPLTVDIHSASARDLAVRNNHVSVVDKLTKALLEREQADYVFDIYCLDVKKTNQTQPKTALSANVLSSVGTEKGNESPLGGGTSVTLIEPLRLSHLELAALRKGAIDHTGDDSSDDSDALLYDGSDSSDYGDEDEDSNDEGDYRNDYPEEEEEEGGGGWLPGSAMDEYDDPDYPVQRRGSESSDEDTTYSARMPMPGGADDLADVWQPRGTQMPQMNYDVGGYNDSDGDSD